MVYQQQIDDNDNEERDDNDDDDEIMENVRFRKLVLSRCGHVSMMVQMVAARDRRWVPSAVVSIPPPALLFQLPRHSARPPFWGDHESWKLIMLSHLKCPCPGLDRMVCDCRSVKPA